MVDNPLISTRKPFFERDLGGMKIVKILSRNFRPAHPEFIPSVTHSRTNSRADIIGSIGHERGRTTISSCILVFINTLLNKSSPNWVDFLFVQRPRKSTLNEEWRILDIFDQIFDILRYFTTK